MDYIKIKFGIDLDEVESRLDQSFDEMFRSVKPLFSLSARNWTPSVDVFETASKVVVRVEVAGVDKADLSVEVVPKAVRIHGRRREARRHQNASYLLAEIQYGTFERILNLPAEIDTQAVSSRYANGILELLMDKQTEKKSLVYKVPINEE
jgi:HSP20 family protein